MNMQTKQTFKKTLMVLVAALLVPGIATSAFAQDSIRNNSIPTTISPEAQKVLKEIYANKAYERAVPAVDDKKGWRKQHAAFEQAGKAKNDKAVEVSKVTVTDAKLGGTPVLDIRPNDWKDNRKVLVYTHGGAYTMFSARSTLMSSAVMARATGLRVISVDYTNPPFARWQEVQEQVISVFKALLAEGYTMKDIALYGDSAGGGLATSTVLNLRDRGMGMPAAVLLWSPWVDLTNAGDTANTLAYTDPLLHYDPLLKNSALAFANGVELPDPRVSPLYADFSKGFSPALITDGTKCIFLSTSVRLYQALEAAGQPVKLDIAEGMWHVYQQTPMPESDVVIKKSTDFIHKHLGLVK
jgi:monoterpene epsilon-lactone hydrolase